MALKFKLRLLRLSAKLVLTIFHVCVNKLVDDDDDDDTARTLTVTVIVKARARRSARTGAAAPWPTTLSRITCERCGTVYLRSVARVLRVTTSARTILAPRLLLVGNRAKLSSSLRKQANNFIVAQLAKPILCGNRSSLITYRWTPP